MRSSRTFNLENLPGIIFPNDPSWKKYYSSRWFVILQPQSSHHLTCLILVFGELGPGSNLLAYRHITNNHYHPTALKMAHKGWFTLATESEAESESEAQGALNQKTESEAELEARRNRSQKDQKSFFFFRFHFSFRCFRSSENKVNGIGSGSGIISQSNNSLPVPFKLRTSLQNTRNHFEDQNTKLTTYRK